MTDRFVSFIVYMKPEPQGSSRAFVKNGRAIITSANQKLRPFRSEVTRMALSKLGDRAQPLFVKGEPVKLYLKFAFQRPASAKKRTHPCVKPDLDKLQRAVLDALTGVMYDDDAQVVEIDASKRYASQDCLLVVVTAAPEHQV
jgi:crossover junction endodeoxyribonuclease RusA